MISSDDQRKLRTFCYKYTRLLELLELGGDALIFEASAILRHFLNDALCQKIANISGLQLKFSIPASYTKMGFRALDPDAIHENNATIEINLSDLLSLQIGEVNSGGEIHQLSSHAVIQATANAGGGVHNEGYDPIDEKTLRLIQDSEEEDLIIARLVRVVVNSITYLFESASGKEGNLFQLSKKRQPAITIDGRVGFLGHNYLEAYSSLNLVEGFTLSFFCLLPPNVPPRKSVLLSFGSRRQSRYFEVWINTDGRINLTIPISANEAETRKVGHTKLGFCNTVFSCCILNGCIRVIGQSMYRQKIRTYSLISPTTQDTRLVGKTVLGADLRGQNGSVFQNPKLIILRGLTSSKGALDLIENAATQRKHWEPLVGEPDAYVSVIYNQSSGAAY